MSAFIVEEAHIDYLVSAGLAYNYHGSPLRWDLSPVEENGLTRDTAQRTGEMLVAANWDSVNYRYDEEGVEDVYTFREVDWHSIRPVVVLKAIACFEYQSCETPDWPTSEARSFCQSLRMAAIHRLEGYENGKGWPLGAADVTYQRGISIMDMINRRSQGGNA
ncbi:MAG: hypothetical protein ABIJ75_07195 [Actinomycetota bacterium]